MHLLRGVGILLQCFNLGSCDPDGQFGSWRLLSVQRSSLPASWREGGGSKGSGSRLTCSLSFKATVDVIFVHAASRL